MCATVSKKTLPVTRQRPALALCLVGVWFSSGCNLADMLDREGNLREATSYRAAYEDTLLEVARRHHLGYVEIVAANPGTDPWLPGDGTNVVLPTVHLLPDAEPEGIVVNLADMRLYLFEKPGAPPRSYPIGIGREGLTTPLGATTVVRKAKEPTWRPTERMREEDPTLEAVVPPGPDNPMGSRALYLGWPTYAIHGTNKPYGVGRRLSSGCVRMYPEDVEELYELVEIGTKVMVVDQPVKLGWIEGDLFIEAHPNQQQSDQLELTGTFESELPNIVVDQVIAAAGEQTHRLDWSRVRTAVLERRGYPIRVTH
jgi:L,D-transpeptidase ErfK/SrfK